MEKHVYNGREIDCTNPDKVVSEEEAFPILMYNQLRPEQLEYATSYQHAKNLIQLGYVRFRSYNVGKVLRHIRVSNKATQKQMVDFLRNKGYKISTSWYCRLETGHVSDKSIRPAQLTQLADIFHIDRHQLYCGRQLRGSLIRRGLFKAVDEGIELSLYKCDVTINDNPATFLVMAPDTKIAGALVKEYVDANTLGILRWSGIHRLITESRVMAVISSRKDAQPNHDVYYNYREHSNTLRENRKFVKAMQDCDRLKTTQ